MKRSSFPKTAISGFFLLMGLLRVSPVCAATRASGDGSLPSGHIGDVTASGRPLDIFEQLHWHPLIVALVLLAISVATGIYLYFSLRREKRLKQALRRQREVALECGHMKSAFLNMMGHEVRTPLNIISGFSEVLASGTVPDSQHKEYLMLIQENSQVLTSLMNDMLEVANLDNCNDDLPMEQLQMDTLLRNVVQYAEANRQGKPIVCRAELPCEGVCLLTNPGYISRVFHELVKNAIKFTERGTITLGCSIDPTTNQAICTVSDTGIGLPADKKEFIFDQFTQINPFVQGTGLGLYMCRLIVNKLGGKIYADTTYTGGCRIVVELPMSKRCKSSS